MSRLRTCANSLTRHNPLRGVILRNVRHVRKVSDLRLLVLPALAAWTGLRWSELRDVRVADFVEIPVPRLVIRRAQPEGTGSKKPKSGKARHVPLVDAVLPLVRSLAAGKEPDDLLVTTENGARPHATAFKNMTHWAETGRG